MHPCRGAVCTTVRNNILAGPDFNSCILRQWFYDAIEPATVRQRLDHYNVKPSDGWTIKPLDSHNQLVTSTDSMTGLVFNLKHATNTTYGKPNWICMKSRPDIIDATSTLQRKQATPTSTDNNAVRQLLQYLKHHPCQLPIAATSTTETELLTLSSKLKVPPYRYRHSFQLNLDPHACSTDNKGSLVMNYIIKVSLNQKN